MLQLQSLLGLFVFVGFVALLGWGMARWRKTAYRLAWRPLVGGLALQFLLAFLVLRTEPGRWVFDKLNLGVQGLLQCSQAGAKAVFGNLSTFTLPSSDGSVVDHGAFFAFNVLPTILFFSALTAIFYHLGVMQLIVSGLAWVMRRTLGTSGMETLSAAANVFVGQTEAPLFVRPYLPTATKSELHAVMVGGFSNIASGVLAAYIGMLTGLIPDAGSHLIAASLISAPAGLAVAKLLVPETETPSTADPAKAKAEKLDANVIDAAARGTTEGMHLALNVGAMLITFTALVAVVNLLLGQIDEGVTLEAILGYAFVPVAWLCGIEAGQTFDVGQYIGIKTVLNEFIAYDMLAGALRDESLQLTDRSKIITLYALCGFANIASIAIQIGGISVLAPERRHDLSRVGLLAMIGGTVASFMTACVVGMLI
ncbi:MAG: nucleoside transporter C-terminal domain-containing protein [Planctomycetota bacterium]